MSLNQPYRPNDVLRQLTKGDESAFRQIYDRYWLSIYKTVKRYTKSPEVAEDIVQEIFTTLWNNRTHFSEVINIEYYLITMAKNLTYKTLRKMAFEKEVRNHWSEEGLRKENVENDAVLDQQYAQLIQHAVGLLPSQQKQIFQMAKVEGLSHKDIAAQLKISHLTVKTHMAKALRTIRHYLQPHLTNLIVVCVSYLFL
jgi:RNA polymerase sigma-70 factor (family 1)